MISGRSPGADSWHTSRTSKPRSGLAHRLSLSVGEKGSTRAPGGLRSRRERHAKTRRLAEQEDRLAVVRADREAGRLHVVRGDKRPARTRQNLNSAQLTEAEWRQLREAQHWFLSSDGESGKRYGNEMLRVTADGEVSIELPSPLTEYANAQHGRHVLAARVRFSHRGTEWRDRIEPGRLLPHPP